MAWYDTLDGNPYNGSLWSAYGEFYLLGGNDTLITFDTDMGGGVPSAYGGDGDDHITQNGIWYAKFYGGDGNDTLVGADGKSDFLFGGMDDDYLLGRMGGDWLYGENGADTLEGGEGDDHLYGGEYNDVLRGGSGIDRMAGDDGDDQYEVTEQKDRVLEHKGEGHDTIFADISFTLGANVEDMILFGTDAVSAKGNDLGNGMAGNTANNVLKGFGGRDNLNGFEGKDKLYGGAGKDYFSFHLTGSANADRIMDFKHKDDTILLERDIFIAINGGDEWKAPTKDQFHASTSGKAADAEDRILYDTTDGKLYYDRDGTGHDYSRV